MTELTGIWQLREGPRVLGVAIVIAIVFPIVAFVLGISRAGAIWEEGGFWNLMAFVTVVLSPLLALRLGKKRPPRARENKSQWALVGDRFLRSPLAHWGFVGVLIVYLVMFLTPWIAPLPYDQVVDAENVKLLGPFTSATADSTTQGYLLGSDQYSRDIFSRILYGSRISLTIGFVAVGLSVSLGLLIGLTAGFFGSWVDWVLMRFVDYLLSIPRLVLLLVVMALFKDYVPQEFRVHMMVAILGLTGWMGTCRIVRSEVLSLKQRDFVQAGRALGLSSMRIMLKHIAPNCLAPVIVAATLGIGSTILVEASLSFLGLGVPEPVPSWGKMVADGKEYITKAWWMTFFPGITIVFAVLSFNLLGDGLRDALDPRSVARPKKKTAKAAS